MRSARNATIKLIPSLRQFMCEDPNPPKAYASPAVPAADAIGRYYRPELDVVRFLAFLLVFAHHSLPLFPAPGTANLPDGIAHVLYNVAWAARFGLSLFFTLSAFLISELLLRERQATGQIHTRQFYIRRILRIWPLYFAGLAIGLCFVTFPVPQHDEIVWTVWAVFLLANWATIFLTVANNPMGVLWSISVEEQFYLFIPWVIKYCSRRLLAAVCVALILVANAWLFCLGRSQIQDKLVWYNSFVQFECFAAGILLCLCLRGQSPRVSIPLRLVTLASAAACWYIAVAVFDAHIVGKTAVGGFNLIAGYALATLGCCLILFAFLGVSHKLLPGWAIYFGRISYGLYVFHVLALDIVVHIFPHHVAVASGAMLFKGAAALGITMLLASLSYRFFESPFLRLKKRFEIVKSRPV
jgi:peptidoglycan/LPS O-acetylase OafA/YrhL